ncbi:hypothetical protein Lal_00022602 [Lupinus albus]|nr:hypothetical protein Lal_00022602 [Lupinus albus]
MGGCFPCFGSSNNEDNNNGVKEVVAKKESFKDASIPQSHYPSSVSSDKSKSRSVSDPKKEIPVPKDGPTAHIAAQTFTFRELAVATKNFRPECLLGEGGFGRVYKGRLENTGQTLMGPLLNSNSSYNDFDLPYTEARLMPFTSSESPFSDWKIVIDFHLIIDLLVPETVSSLVRVVAVKQLDRNGLQGNREFLVEVLMLSLLHHPNLVNLIGYCADGDQRLLVYEFMPLGSLEDHLHDLPPDKEPLDWNTRMKIAAGAAKGLEYLHDKANPPVIYRDLKSSNILLDEGYHPKLSDFGLAKLGPVGDKTHVSTRVMGTYGYCAPEYAMTGQLTLKSDVYSFGVVFLELITGRKAIDNTRSHGEHNLVAWARPLFKDRRKFPKMADPLLQGHYPMRGLYQALAVAAMCLQEQAATRPLIGDVVTALTYLASQTYDPNAPNLSNRLGGPSTPRSKDDRRNMGDGVDSPDRGRIGSPSAHRNSPDYRKRDSRDPSSGTEFGRSVSNGGSGRKWGLDDVERQESQKDSPVNTGRARETPRNRDLDRERAVAEARVWGENWREKKRANAMGSFDATN